VGRDVTAEVVLREVEDADLELFFAHQQDVEAIRMAAYTAEDPGDRAAFDGHWQRIRASEDITVRTILVGGAVAGHVASYVDADVGEPEVTYWIGREHWGRGVATAALEAFLAVVGTRPLFARAAKDNVASRRVLEKCGFAVVGESRGVASGRGAEVDEVLLRLD
jgi:RimJ/RimL family protein N-acetyltransferase